MPIQWKALDIYPEINNIYEVSEHGHIRSIDRVVFVDAGARGAYERYYTSREINSRRGTKNPHLFVTISKKMNGKTWKETIYVHKIVAQLFIDSPKDPKKVYVEHIDDDFNNNHHSNLRWISHSELQIRNMNERHPENKDKLKNANIKSGYYQNVSKFKKKNKAKLL